MFSVLFVDLSQNGGNNGFTARALRRKNRNILPAKLQFLQKLFGSGHTLLNLYEVIFDVSDAKFFLNVRDRFEITKCHSVAP